MSAVTSSKNLWKYLKNMLAVTKVHSKRDMGIIVDANGLGHTVYYPAPFSKSQYRYQIDIFLMQFLSLLC